MKSILVAIMLIFQFRASAEYRQIKLAGKDANDLSEIFNRTGRNTSIANPVTGVVINMFFDFQAEPGSFAMKCVAKNTGTSSEHSCTLDFDTRVTDGSVLVSASPEHSLSVEFSGREVVKTLKQNLGDRREFASQTKALDGQTPLLRFSCAQESAVCHLTAAN